MKRTLLYYSLAALAIGAVLLGCRRDRLYGSDGKPEPGISVQEARDFFEQQAVTTKAAAYLNAASDHPRGFSPGDFTPLWDRATRAAANQWVEGVDLPIDPKFIFTAVFKATSAAGDTLRHTVDITQKLVVNRWHNHPRWEGMYAYIATIIPEAEYAARHKNIVRSFVNLGQKRDFSGVVVYHNLEGRFVNADKYADGVMVAQVYDEQGTSIDQQAAIHGLLGDGVMLYGGTPQAYRIGIESDEIEVLPGDCERCHRPYQNCICCNVCQHYPCKCPGPGIGPEVHYCERCGAQNYSGICYNCGVTPPGGGTTPETGNVPTDNGLFSFPNLTKAEARIINDILNKINDAKTAKTLRELFNNKQVKVTIVTNANLTSLGQFSATQNKITFRSINLAGDFKAEQENTQILIHEMFHAFHHYYEGIDGNLKGVADFQAYMYTTIYMRQNGYNNFYAPADKDATWNKNYSTDIQNLMNRTGNNPSREDIMKIYTDYGYIFKELGGQTAPMPENPNMDPLYIGLGTPL